MPERIPELDRLAAEAKEVDMLPAAEIRRLGNRRRTTRHVAVAGVVAALALVAGLGIWQSPLLEQYRNPQWANTAIPETPSPAPTETARCARCAIGVVQATSRAQPRPAIGGPLRSADRRGPHRAVSAAGRRRADPGRRVARSPRRRFRPARGGAGLFPRRAFFRSFRFARSRRGGFAGGGLFRRRFAGGRFFRRRT